MTQNTSTIASYTTSIVLFLKGVFEAVQSALAAIPLESKVGIVLGVGTFLINWYYRRRADRRAERIVRGRHPRQSEVFDE